MGANKVVQKSKEAKMKAAMAGGKSRKPWKGRDPPIGCYIKVV